MAEVKTTSLKSSHQIAIERETHAFVQRLRTLFDNPNITVMGSIDGLTEAQLFDIAEYNNDKPDLCEVAGIKYYLGSTISGNGYQMRATTFKQ